MFERSATEIFRDYNTEGVPASGLYKPSKADIRTWGAAIEAAMVSGDAADGSLGKTTKANLDADLVHPADTLAWVYGDSTAANNGVYKKVGASGTGSWTRISDLPFSIIPLTVTGGTPNAIVATSALPIPVGDRAALITLIPSSDNSIAVTIAINGAAPIAILDSVGNPLGGGALATGRMSYGFMIGGNLHLVGWSDAPSSKNLYRQPDSMQFPGSSNWAFSKTLAGVPEAGVAIDAGAAVANAWRLTNQSVNIAMRDWYRVDAGVPLQASVTLQRIVNSVGGSTITFGLICMDASGVELGRQFGTYTLTVADGRRTLTHIISDTVNTSLGINKAWTAGTVYVRPYCTPSGTDHTTDVISMKIGLASSLPVARNIADNLLYTDWSETTAYMAEERRTRLNSGGPIIYRPASNVLYLYIDYGDSNANNHSAGFQDRLPFDRSRDVHPYALMLDCSYAPGVDVASETISATAYRSFSDRANRRTSTAALGQPGSIGAACKFVQGKRERLQAQELLGFAPCGIGGAQLVNIKKTGATAMSGVSMWNRLMNVVQKWLDIAATYGLTVNIPCVHLIIGSNDTAANYTGGLTAYKADLTQLITDLQNDLKTKTGQAAVPFIAFGTTASTSEALVPSIAWGQLADTYRGSTTVMSLGPRYAYAHGSINHLDLDGTVLAGERLAIRNILGLASAGNRPKVLYPSAANWTGSTCVLTIADSTTLVIDTDALPAHAKYGFDCATLAISSVTVSTNTITVTFASAPPSGTVLTYAQGPHTDNNLLPSVSGMSRGWGNIRETANASFHYRGEIIPTWVQANGTIKNRAMNNRDFYHYDWLHNFETTKP